LAEKEKEAAEPNETILFNPCRVVPAQERYIQFLAVGESYAKPDGTDGEIARYKPIIPGRTSGFVVLEDTRKGEVEEVLEFSTAPAATEKVTEGVGQAQPSTSVPVAEEEAPPPEAFEWEG
jgi:26S proteasome regulatory subunit N2